MYYGGTVKKIHMNLNSNEYRIMKMIFKTSICYSCFAVFFFIFDELDTHSTWYIHI
jgi:hypothetical protein